MRTAGSVAMGLYELSTRQPKYNISEHMPTGVLPTGMIK
jgi:hypothetical protein